MFGGPERPVVICMKNWNPFMGIGKTRSRLLSVVVPGMLLSAGMLLEGIVLECKIVSDRVVFPVCLCIKKGKIRCISNRLL